MSQGFVQKLQIMRAWNASRDQKGVYLLGELNTLSMGEVKIIDGTRDRRKSVNLTQGRRKELSSR